MLSNTELNMKDGFLKALKLFLFCFVAFFVVVNYYALTEVVSALGTKMNAFGGIYGYYFDIKKPLKYIFEIIPFGIPIFYSITLNTKDVIGKVREIYKIVSILQLLLLAIILPVLLFFQNKFFSKIKT